MNRQKGRRDRARLRIEWQAPTEGVQGASSDYSRRGRNSVFGAFVNNGNQGRSFWGERASGVSFYAIMAGLFFSGGAVVVL